MFLSVVSRDKVDSPNNEGVLAPALREVASLLGELISPIETDLGEPASPLARATTTADMRSARFPIRPRLASIDCARDLRHVRRELGAVFGVIQADHSATLE